MKTAKILSVVVAAIMLLTIAASAAAPVYVIDLTNADNVANWGGIHSENISYDEAEGATLFEVTDSDPYALYSIAAEDQFTGADYRWVKICYKANSDGNDFGTTQFFWKNEQYSGPVAETNFNWDREEEGAWVETIVEILPNVEDAWDSTLQGFRLDPFQQGSYSAEEKMWVKYIAFFATEDDAKAYTFAPVAAAEEPAAAEAPAEAADVVVAPAAQTADMFSAAIVVLAVSALAGAAVCSKKH